MTPELRFTLAVAVQHPEEQPVKAVAVQPVQQAQRTQAVAVVPMTETRKLAVPALSL